MATTKAYTRGHSATVEWPEDIYADRVLMSHKQVFVN